MYDKTMEKYLYQMFILGIDNIDEALSKGLGGAIFFTKDIASVSKVKNAISDIKNKALIPPFISIDQEGGRVERTENIRSKRLSPKVAFAKGFDYLTEQSEEISKELSDLGFNLNFAPCVDVNTNPANPIIGERAFSNNPDDVIKGMKIFIEASKKYHVIPCVKHYPGHGDASADSHLTLPNINLSLDDMVKNHIKPFKVAVNDGVEMIMAAHLHCCCFDEDVIPSSLSKNVINYLRDKLNYKGIIISDDMVMKGVEQYGMLDACLKGIEAGLDMFIIRNSDKITLNMIDELLKVINCSTYLQEKVVNSYNKIINLKLKYLY